VAPRTCVALGNIYDEDRDLKPYPCRPSIQSVSVRCKKYVNWGNGVQHHDHLRHFRRLARRLFGQPFSSAQGKRRAVWVAIAGVAACTMFVGASAVVVRAALMGILRLWRRHLGRAAFAPVSLAAAAIVQITLLPIMLYYFGQLSLVTLVTNFLILPAQPGVMIWGGLALLLGLVAQPLGQVVGRVAWVFLTYTIGVVQLTAQALLASAPMSLPTLTR